MGVYLSFLLTSNGCPLNEFIPTGQQVANTNESLTSVQTLSQERCTWYTKQDVGHVVTLVANR